MTTKINRYAVTVAIATVLSLIPVSQSAAHEFWIEPIKSADPEVVTAQVRNGEYFQGQELPFMPERIVAATVFQAKSEQVLTGQAGQFPAIQYATQTRDLQIVSYQSTDAQLVHENFAGFKQYLEEDGLQWALEYHLANELPQAGFGEKFTRYAKALIVRADGGNTDLSHAKSTDRLIGLPYELLVTNVQSANSASDNEATEVSLQLFEKGLPVADTQITVFAKTDSMSLDEAPTKIRTNSNGEVVVVVSSGSEVLASAVVIEPVEADDALWHSHWASTTFKVE